MIIEIIEVGQSYKKGKYQELELEYKDDKGNDKTQTIRDFVSKEVWQVLSDSQPGDKVDITLTKNGQYWNWTGAKKAKAASTSNAKPAYNTGSTYPSKEEREQTQKHIIRQSMLKAAVDFSNGQFTKEEVVGIAAYFEGYVYEGADISTPDDIYSMQSDEVD